MIAHPRDVAAGLAFMHSQDIGASGRLLHPCSPVVCLLCRPHLLCAVVSSGPRARSAGCPCAPGAPGPQAHAFTACMRGSGTARGGPECAWAMHSAQHSIAWSRVPPHHRHRRYRRYPPRPHIQHCGRSQALVCCSSWGSTPGERTLAGPAERAGGGSSLAPKFGPCCSTWRRLPWTPSSARRKSPTLASAFSSRTESRTQVRGPGRPMSAAKCFRHTVLCTSPDFAVVLSDVQLDTACGCQGC